MCKSLAKVEFIWYNELFIVKIQERGHKNGKNCSRYSRPYKREGH